MCGVPFHSASGYIQKLVDNGHKVAIVEQLTDPGKKVLLNVVLFKLSHQVLFLMNR